MKSVVTIKPNPSRQERNHKVLEVSFTKPNGDYRGCLIALNVGEDYCSIKVYRIDEGINVWVDEKREKPYQ